MTIKERFTSKVRYEPTTGCLTWTGGVFKDGYGIFSVNRVPKSAHRVGWQLFMGEIDRRVHIHHLCENKLCVNPGHLSPVTAKHHALLTYGTVGRNSMLSSACPQGNPYNHTYKGLRLCRTCLNQSDARWRSKNPEKVRLQKHRHYLKYRDKYIAQARQRRLEATP